MAQLAALTMPEIVTMMFRAIGVVGAGQSASGTKLNEGCLAINLLIDQWKAQRNMIYAVNRTTVDFVANQLAYTIGPGADIDIPRPLAIQNASVELQSTPPYEFGIGVLDDNEYAAVALKQLGGSLYPVAVYLDNSFQSPEGWGQIKLVWIPNGGQPAAKLVLYCATAVEPFDPADTSTTYRFPPAYLNAIILGGADALLTYYPRPMDQKFYDRLKDALAAITTTNQYVPTLGIDPAIPTQPTPSGSRHHMFQWMLPPWARP